jgi:hypothetical protein
VRASGGQRIEWTEVPDAVRARVEEALGAAVVEAVNQGGGFSPGVAARCRLADGRRAFVKAVSPAQNEHACRIQRREAEVAARLPDDVPAPRLRHVVDDGTWVVLVFDDVDGRTPDEPWTWAELDVVMPAIVELGRSATPTPVHLPSAGDKHRAIFQGWRRLRRGDGDVSAVDDWARSRLDELATLEAGWEEAAAGETLLHADLRADNVLLGADGSVTFVDWPWACVGAAFFDPLLMLPSIGLSGGPAPHDVVARYGLFADVDHEDVLAVAVAMAGFFTRACLDPAPQGLPALPAFQRAQSEVALAWVRTLLS